MKRRYFDGGFTLLELIVVIAVAALLVGLVLPSIGRTHHGGRQWKDSAQVRGLHQAFLSWAQNNADHFPLASLIDVNNTTVAEVGPAKDHTANLLSPLVFNGFIPPEMLVSPAEASGKITVKDNYEYESPKAAVDPSHALWDPSLSADFASTAGGHISYGHMLPSGARSEQWTNSYSGAQPMVGNRGPEIRSVKQHADGTVVPTLANPDTVTFLIHGSRKRWEGNIAFADNHVEFATQTKAGTYTDAGGKAREDVLFFDEPDDAAGTNAFLGVFTKAGPVPSSFKSIWD